MASQKCWPAIWEKEKRSKMVERDYGRLTLYFESFSVCWFGLVWFGATHCGSQGVNFWYCTKNAHTTVQGTVFGGRHWTWVHNILLYYLSVHSSRIILVEELYICVQELVISLCSGTIPDGESSNSNSLHAGQVLKPIYYLLSLTSHIFWSELSSCVKNYLWPNNLSEGIFQQFKGESIDPRYSYHHRLSWSALSLVLVLTMEWKTNGVRNESELKKQ